MAQPLPESWQPYALDVREPIPGDVVREVAGYKVHRINGVDYLSIGTVTKILRFGDLSHIPRQYLDPAAERGKAVGEYIAEILKHDPTGGRYFSRIVAQSGDDVIPAHLRPYVEAAGQFIDARGFRHITTEALCINASLRVFGYSDACGVDGIADDPPRPLTVDWKTGASIYHANRWQITLYTPVCDRGMLVQLGKDGRYHETPCCTDEDRRQLCAAAELAHLYIAEREQSQKRKRR